MDVIATFFSPRPSCAASLSSSDFDTQSTGSFFPDRSTTLAALISITFSDSSFRLTRLPSQRQSHGHHGNGGRRGGDGGLAEDAAGEIAAVLRASQEEWFLDAGGGVAEDVEAHGLLLLAGVECAC